MVHTYLWLIDGFYFCFFCCPYHIDPDVDATVSVDLIRTHQSDPFMHFLASWSSSLPTSEQRIAQLSRDIAQAGWGRAKELEPIDSWVEDLYSVGYLFPAIVPSSWRIGYISLTMVIVISFQTGSIARLNRFFTAVDDGFAVGSMDLMFHGISRHFSVFWWRRCRVHSLTLKYLGLTTIIPIGTLASFAFLVWKVLKG